jgi:cold shock CspA family protein
VAQERHRQQKGSPREVRRVLGARSRGRLSGWRPAGRVSRSPRVAAPRPPEEAAGGPRQSSLGEAHAVVRIIARGLTGRLKQYDASRGYGFVVSSDAPGDVFFHRSDCLTDPSVLETQAEVAFDLVEMANGHLKAARLGLPRGGRSQEQSPPPATEAGRRRGSRRPATGTAVAPTGD